MGPEAVDLAENSSTPRLLTNSSAAPSLPSPFFDGGRRWGGLPLRPRQQRPRRRCRRPSLRLSCGCWTAWAWTPGPCLNPCKPPRGRASSSGSSRLGRLWCTELPRVRAAAGAGAGLPVPLLLPAALGCAAATGAPGPSSRELLPRAAALPRQLCPPRGGAALRRPRCSRTCSRWLPCSPATTSSSSSSSSSSSRSRPLRRPPSLQLDCRCRCFPGCRPVAAACCPSSSRHFRRSSRRRSCRRPPRPCPRLPPTVRQWR